MEDVKFGRRVKQLVISELVAKFKDSDSLFITECGKLTNKELEDLRKRLRKSSAKYLVVKNTMCSRAFAQIGLEKMRPLIKDRCGVGYDFKDPVATSKVFVDFNKENEKFSISGACIDGNVVDLKTVKELAAIPSREALLGRLAGALNSPISGMVGVLSGVIRKFVYAINAIKDKKQGGS